MKFQRKEIAMSKTQPIKNLKKVEELKQYYLDKGNLRDYVLVTLGLNTALRISDLLNLKWNDVYDFKIRRFKDHICIVEHKTGKRTLLALNKVVVSSLKSLKRHLKEVYPTEYIFKSMHNGKKPIDRVQAFRIIREGAKKVGIQGNISCHSMRKTFGYWAWKKGIPPAVIMAIFNHSSIEITKLYLSIDQDDKDEVFMQISL